MRIILPFVLGLLAASLASPAHAAKPAAVPPPATTGAHRGYIVTDAATGRVLLEENSDAPNPPASVTKLMTFLVVHDKITARQLSFDTPVTISLEAQRMGGSQVYLETQERFTVDDLLYALMVQSANDAAIALAEAAAGSREAFVELMNTRAHQLGMTHTTWRTPHGLPPNTSLGQEPDLASPRDIALLSRHLLLNTDILRYTSTKTRDFRPGPKVQAMKNHNHLLWRVNGCDGLKTGYYAKAGFSLAATVQRNDRRIIVVTLGVPERKQRDVLVASLIEKGFAALPSDTPPFRAQYTPIPRPVALTPADAPPPSGADATAGETPAIRFVLPGQGK
ncbi:D-alanyl-D-alanine carboxypeptidase family protein [Geminisphaera colitermitum]|uniref:D-alanyl-D-alanine carboxypeptidase family protein n=1 Tax=Geminisphaera colitermitum TaxID=1148786 RepID=UPI0009DD9DB5|nr:D-alanyl-D-alanine carboxypeptidase family protein [Geminisphaera colitermitum]